MTIYDIDIVLYHLRQVSNSKDSIQTSGCSHLELHKFGISIYYIVLLNVLLMFHLFHMFHRAQSPWALRKAAAWTDPTNQVTTSLRGCADNRSETSKCWYLRRDKFLQHISSVHHVLYAPYHRSPKIHACINLKVPWYPCQTMQYLGLLNFLCLFRKRFTSGRQMHSRVKPGSAADKDKKPLWLWWIMRITFFTLARQASSWHKMKKCWQLQ